MMSQAVLGGWSRARRKLPLGVLLVMGWLANPHSVALGDEYEAGQDENEADQDENEAGQDENEADQEEPSLEALATDGRWEIETTGRSLALSVGGVAALDYRQYDSRNTRDTGPRWDRGVLRFDGRLDERLDARLGIDLRGTDTRLGLEEAWVRYEDSRSLRFTLGLIEMPLSFESSLAREDQPLVGDGFATYLGTRSDFGARLDGEFEDGLLYYDLSLGIGEGFDRFGQDRESPQLSLRFQTHPFRSHENRLVAGLFAGFGFAWSSNFRGNLDVATPMRNKIFLTEELRAEEARFFQLTAGADIGPVRGVFDLVPGELFEQWFGSGSGLLDARIPSGGRKDLDQVGAWELGFSWMITGEHYDSRLYDIRKNGGRADPLAARPLSKGGFGSLELAMRYNNSDIDRGFFQTGLTAEGVSAQEFRTFSTALNWYPSPDLRLTLQGVRTLADGTPAVFEHGGRDTSFLFRVQRRF